MLLLIIQVVIVALLVLALKPLGAVLNRANQSISRMEEEGQDDQPAPNKGQAQVFKTVIVVCVGLIVFMACLNIFKISLMYLTVPIASLIRMKTMPISIQALSIMSYVLSGITALATAFYAHINLKE
ncbi:MAG: hypothetical protein KAR83_04465 [Thermodesulfovibrionales bacterium]|nr:hypothetical protein [Thermodesulfovibrionales bacterium]